MAGWIKVPLGVEVGIGPGHIVLDEDPAAPQKGLHSSPNFRPMYVVAKRLDGSRCYLVWHFGPGHIVTACRNARIASAVLAAAISSVCLSVRLSRQFYVKTQARCVVQFALSDSKMCLVL